MPADEISMAMQQYRHALDGIKHDMDAKKWEHLVVCNQVLDAASEALRKSLDGKDITQAIGDDLQQLSIEHRRVVRQLNQYMNKVKEDLLYVEQSLNKTKYMAEFVGNEFTFPE